MELEILSKQHFQRSLEEVCEKLVAKIEEIDPQKKIYTVEDLCQLLRISKRTSQTYRDKGLIEYSQVGGKIFFTWDQIMAFLEKYKVEIHK